MLKVGEIVQTVKGIIEARIGLVKEEIRDEFLSILSRIILLVVIGSMLLLSFLFLSLSLAFFLSQVTQSPYLGFLLVALMFILVVFVLYLTRDSLRLQQKTADVLKDFVFTTRKRKSEDEQ